MAKDEQNFSRLLFVIVILSIMLPMPRVMSQETGESLDLQLRGTLPADSTRQDVKPDIVAYDSDMYRDHEKLGRVTIFYADGGVDYLRGYEPVERPAGQMSVDLYSVDDSTASGIVFNFAM